MARIEDALARIERAVVRPVAADPDLERRHAQLRARVEDAIAALDELIAREDIR